MDDRSGGALLESSEDQAFVSRSGRQNFLSPCVSITVANGIAVLPRG
jgi:hypothetical protein